MDSNRAFSLSWADKAEQVDYNFLINGYINQNSMVTAMEIDLLDNLWIGTLHGLIVYEINDDRVSFLSTNAGIAGNDISSLFADSKGRIWIGSNQKGLTIYNDKDTSFTILKAGLGYTPTCMTESADKEIWVGTQAHGLLVFKDLDLLRQYRMIDGLSSDYIASLTAGINGDIFIGTSRGLNIFKKDENQFRRYSEKAGFTGIEVKRNASVTDADGNVWFGTVNGATRVDISSEKEKPSVPPIRINNLKVNMVDRKITDHLVLSYDENSIVIEYVGICLTDPQSVIYRIMLEGPDNEWQPETNQNFASFSNLAPGKYTFKVIAKNNSGIWNTEPAILKFTIKPPFYNSISFYLIIVVSTIVLFIAFIKYRERALIIEKRVLAEKVAERTVEISIKNRELELKNKNITDSIKYAKRIQDAMLPDNEYLRGIFANYFIYFKPRDIISGDFYWATRKDEKIIFAVVDCTGHGVPGAFMSMLGITLFDEIVNKKNILDAGQILDNLREDVIKSLKQKGVRGETQDGMDVSLCVINTHTWEMQFAGAYSPMYLIRDNEIMRLKGDRMPIGIYYKKTEKFQKQSLQLKDNDMIYLFTDGYADQFSEERGEKFMNKNLRNLLLEIFHKPLDKQKKILEENLKKWQGNLDQVDDILIFGTRIYTAIKTL
jgi:serine phosphatase RsbU (regulator of sigma subunit)